MTWEFVPYKSYGPINFGISQNEAVALLGSPAKVSNQYESLEPVLDPELFEPRYLEILKRRDLMKFPDSASNNKRPELIFSDNKLVYIYLANSADHLEVHSVDVWGKDRVDVVIRLARMEKVVLFSGSDYYFESAGVRVVAPRAWKRIGSVGLYSKLGFEEEMTLSGPYEYAPEEVTGQEQ